VLRILLILVGLFKAVMLVDAYRRKAETYWLWIIPTVPGGALLYLFLVRLRQPGPGQLAEHLRRFLEKPTTVEELEHRYLESPSVANRLSFGQGLGDAGRYREALRHFEAVLSERADDADALFGEGVCLLELGENERAIAALGRLLELAPGYRDFALYPELSRAFKAAGRSDERLELLEGLAKRHPQLPHALWLFRCKEEMGQGFQAQKDLELAYRRFNEGPKHVRRRYGDAGREVQAILAGTARG
jgi:hypothetical protein